jgi:hypothetical protein
LKKTLIVILLYVNFAFTDDGTIVADRPGFSTGTYTVKENKLNIELGYQDSFSDSDSVSTQTFPQMVLRTGLSSTVELDLMWDGWNIDSIDSASSTSKADLTIGGKYRLYQSSQYNFTALGLLSLPTGNGDSTSGKIDPTLGFLWDYTLSDTTGLFGVVQSSSYVNNDTRVYDAQFAIGSSYNYTNLLSVFIEVYTVLPSDSTIDNESAIDGGITYLLTKDIQLDINGAIDNNDNNVIGLGIAWRI